MSKEENFNEVLQSAKRALDSINVPFHLHAGTALGAHREKTFIPHDHDIDLAVFYKDVNTREQVKAVEKAMKKEGFTIEARLGKLERGKEIQFEKDNIPLDIFWVYEGKYKGTDYYLVSSYYGDCDKLKYKTCIWGYRPYETVRKRFLGKTYNVVPKYTLTDMYGKDWRTPKKFGYHEGIISGYKGFLKDYYNPREVTKKVAYCFLLYDTVKHSDIWINYFNQDNYPDKSYNIYTHLKEVNEKTQQWVKDNKIRNVKTGWCEEGLVKAWIKLIKAAINDDPTNEYFVLLSGECIPLFTYEKIYKRITASKKSRVNIDYNNASLYDIDMYYADQWVILNKKCAQLLIDLYETDAGKSWLKNARKQICDVQGEDICYCPDEIFPVNWFIHNFGSPGSSSYRKEIRDIPATYTYWSTKGKPHPVKFNSKQMNTMKKKICKSGALFGRKFNNKAARELAMTC